MHKFSSRIFVLAIAAYLLFGNTPRVLPWTVGFGSLNLLEPILAILAIFILTLNPKILLVRSLSQIGILVTITSALIGLAKFGIDELGLLYSSRLIFLIFIGIVGGHGLSKIYGIDSKSLARHISFLYFFIALLGIFLLILFPDSSLLWSFLSDMNVNVRGDPHVGRLVSLYFDPNLYGAMAIFPAAVSLYLFRTDLNYRYLFMFFAILISIILTISRSSYGAVLIGVTFLIIVGFFRFVSKGRIRKESTQLLFLTIIICSFAYAVFYTELNSGFSRLLATSTEDGSTYDRIVVFSAGMEMFAKEPLLGYGYNNSLRLFQNLDLLGFDSGLQSLLVNYGLVLTAVMFTCFILSVRKINRALVIHGVLNKDVVIFWRIYLFYLTISICFTGIFNQLLFYPFWLVPAVSLYVYFERVTKKRGLDAQKSRNG